MFAIVLAMLPQGAPPAMPVVSPAPVVGAVEVPAGAAELPVGKAERTLDLDGTRLQVFTYRPETWRKQRMLIVCHGVLRNADEYRDHAVSMGDRFAALIVAPRFDAERFPTRSYQRGGIVREDGTAAPPHEWTYALIPRLAAAVREVARAPELRFWIIGHSAGGQFAMRMSAFQDTGAEGLVAANPGTALWPTRSMKFGYGFGGLPAELADDQRIQRYLAAPLTIYLGTDDDAPDEHFDDSAAGMEQGRGRHQRGLACYWTARTLAELRGWTFGWRLVEAPGVGHDHEKMFEHERCGAALFGEPETADEAQRARR
jgi:pimeloyl-ACP methyl ester carboxylesterase